MQVKMYGTRGSTPGQPRGSHKFGGNTTCLRIVSECLPKGWGFVVDAGSGLVHLSQDLLKESIKNLGLIFTHYHHDHTQGLFLAPHTFMADSIKVWGPYEHGVGPHEVIGRLMAQPLFPVEFAMVKHRFNFVRLEHIGTQVLVIHPKAGFHLMPINKYRQCEKDGKGLPFRGGSQSIDECLVVFMWKTSHPEYTVSYRFEEKPTGRTFVFLTDHEVTASFPKDMITHLRGAHFLIQDGQYAKPIYEEKTGGFGHGTPEYCVATAVEASIGRMGITHHDPSATDADIEERLAEAVRCAVEMGNPLLAKQLFACADYDVYEV